jgi:hypothetical protein
MPVRRITRRRRAARSKVVRAKRGIPAKKKSRSLGGSPSYFFKRSYTQDINLSIATYNSSIARLDNNSAYGLDAIVLNALPGLSDFTSLFGGYKIHAVKYKITPNLTQTDRTDAGDSTPQVKLITVYDPFSHLSSNPTTTTRAEIDQYQNQRVRNLIQASQGEGLGCYFKTRQQANVDLTGVADGYSNVKPRWCSTTETTALHTGPALFVETVDGSLFSDSALKLKVETIYYLEFKNVR